MAGCEERAAISVLVMRQKVEVEHFERGELFDYYSD